MLRKGSAVEFDEMASVTGTIEKNSGQSGLRSFDSRRDLAKVADLVELCFADTLDRSGRDYLARLRASAARSTLLGSSAKLPGSSMNGIVWEENNRLIGNVSLIPFYVNSQRNFLIANVAVHPDWRRRGIARQMTMAAVDYVRQRNLNSVWLHVRVENHAAIELYQSLGFIQKAVRTTWVAEPAAQVGEIPTGLHFRSPSLEQWDALKGWYKRAYPARFSWHLPFHLTTLHPGLLGTAARVIFSALIAQWGASLAGELKAGAAWQAVDSNANLLYLAAPVESDPFIIRSLLDYCLQHIPTRRTVHFEYPADQFEQPIREAGFVEQQVLAWMELPIES